MSNDTKPAILSAAEIEAMRAELSNFSTRPYRHKQIADALLAHLDALRYELAELGPARPLPPDPKRGTRVAEIVAWRVLDRWAAAGIARAYLDAQGAPTPLLDEPEHVVQVVAGRTSPSGKTLFTCARCPEPERPVPPRGPCRGVAAHSLLYPVRDFLAAGGRFEPDAAGILRPVARGLVTLRTTALG